MTIRFILRILLCVVEYVMINLRGWNMATLTPSKPATFRLPQWALDFLDRTAAERHESKTQIVVEAVALMRDRELAMLMEEGYREMADEARVLAESSLSVAAETLPEW
jgi:hypothetical protein